MLMFALLFSKAVIADEAREWKNLYSCVSKHIADVARVVPSLEEGALLLTENTELCANESVSLNNYLAKNRTDNIGEVDFLSKFSRYTYIIRRDVKFWIYREKIKSKQK